MRRIRDQNGTWALVSCRWPPLASRCPVSVQRAFPLLGLETSSPSMSCSCHLVRRAPRWSSELPPADPSVVVPVLSTMSSVADSFPQRCSMSMDCRGGAGGVTAALQQQILRPKTCQSRWSSDVWWTCVLVYGGRVGFPTGMPLSLDLLVYIS